MRFPLRRRVSRSTISDCRRWRPRFAARGVISLVGVLVCALLSATGALAASTGTIKGTVAAISSSSLTIQTAGRSTGVINALTATADAITKGDYPYVWAGGHAEAGTPSVGTRGPGYNGHRIGFDCSGSVVAVLAGGGLWSAGSGVPGDAGVIKQLMQNKLIARGPGRAPDEVTLYDDPGVHIFMNINGRFFGTSDGGGGNSKGGPTWLDDGAPDAVGGTYKRYHVLPHVLKQQTTYGQNYTFQIDPHTSLSGGIAPGDDVQISYSEARTGIMIAHAIGYADAITASGTLTSIAADGSSFVITTAAGHQLMISAGDLTSLIDGGQIGDKVVVVYTKSNGVLTAHTVTVTTPPVVSS